MLSWFQSVVRLVLGLLLEILSLTCALSALSGRAWNDQDYTV